MPGDLTDCVFIKAHREDRSVEWIRDAVQQGVEIDVGDNDVLRGRMTGDDLIQVQLAAPV